MGICCTSFFTFTQAQLKLLPAATASLAVLVQKLSWGQAASALGAAVPACGEHADDKLACGRGLRLRFATTSLALRGLRFHSDCNGHQIVTGRLELSTP